MAKGAKPTSTFVNKKPIHPGTPEMESYLQSGYGDMSVEEAKLIIKARKENPQFYPYEVEKKARAFLAAYEGVAVAVDTEPGWKRYPELQED